MKKNIKNPSILSEVAGSIAMFAVVYIGLCVLFSAQAGTEYQGAYMPIWHWPIKVLAYFVQ
jgi:hypothetical protein